MNPNLIDLDKIHERDLLVSLGLDIPFHEEITRHTGIGFAMFPSKEDKDLHEKGKIKFPSHPILSSNSVLNVLIATNSTMSEVQKRTAYNIIREITYRHYKKEALKETLPGSIKFKNQSSNVIQEIIKEFEAQGIFLGEDKTSSSSTSIQIKNATYDNIIDLTNYITKKMIKATVYKHSVQFRISFLLSFLLDSAYNIVDGSKDGTASLLTLFTQMPNEFKSLPSFNKTFKDTFGKDLFVENDGSIFLDNVTMLQLLFTNRLGAEKWQEIDALANKKGREKHDISDIPNNRVMPIDYLNAIVTIIPEKNIRKLLATHFGNKALIINDIYKELLPVLQYTKSTKKTHVMLGMIMNCFIGDMIVPYLKISKASLSHMKESITPNKFNHNN